MKVNGFLGIVPALCAGLTLAVAPPASGADRGLGPIDNLSAIVFDSSRSPEERVQAAKKLSSSNKLTPDEAAWLFSDLILTPGVALDLQEWVENAAFFLIPKQEMVSMLAGFCANPVQKAAVNRVATRLGVKLLPVVVLDALLQEKKHDIRMDAAIVIREIDFSEAAWSALTNAWSTKAEAWKRRDRLYARDLVRRLADDPDPLVRAAVLKVLPYAPNNLTKIGDEFSWDIGPAVLEKIAGERPDPESDGAKSKSFFFSQLPSKKTDVLNTHPYAGKKPEIVAYRARLDAMRELQEQDWFRISFVISPDFRRRFESLVGTAAKSGARPTISAGSFPAAATLDVNAPLPETPVLLNAVFVGRTPLVGLAVPPDTYTITVAERDRIASRDVKAEGRENKVSFEEKDFRNRTGDAPLPSPEANELTVASWWNHVDGREFSAMVPVPGGVVVLSVRGGNPILRLYERTNGNIRWEATIGLAPTSSIVRQGGRLYWGAGDSMLHAADLESGKTTIITALDGTMELAPRTCEKTLVCATWDSVKGGRVTAVDSETGQKRWTFRTDGRPRNLLVLADAVVVANAGPGGGGKIVCLEAGNGRERWSRSLRILDGMLLDGDGNFVFLRDGDESQPATFLDVRSGTTLLTVETEAGALVIEALIRGDHAALITSEARLFWVDLPRRSLQWSRALPVPNAREIRLSLIGPNAVAVMAGGLRRNGLGDVREGTLRIISPTTGATLFIEELGLREPPIDLGDGRMLLVDAGGELVMRDLRRGWTPMRFSTRAAHGAKDAISAVAQDDAAYLVSTLQNRIYTFELRAKP